MAYLPSLLALPTPTGPARCAAADPPWCPPAALAPPRHVPAPWPSAAQALVAGLLRRTEPPTARRPAPLVYALWRNVQHVFDARHIARFFAADRYICFLHGGREFLLRGSLAALQRRLRAYGFVSVHRAELINLRRVASLQRHAGRLQAVLSDGQRAQVARRLARRLQAELALCGAPPRLGA